MDINSALGKLYSLQKFGIKLGLQNISDLLRYLGNPQESFESFHIAGSNGKGSTASFIASILQETGYNTGLYTSPHFVRFNERVRVNGAEIPDEYIAEFINSMEQYLKSHSPTFFEVTTALAFKYFADSNIEYGVIETGLGGRLDATNVLRPLSSVITSISKEHTEILGETLEEITGEKAGIIKKDSLIFIGKLPDISENIISNICAKKKCKLYKLNSYIVQEENNVSLDTPAISILNIEPGLNGEFQKYNAALAALVVSQSLGILDVNIYSVAFSNIVKNTGIQGRYEIYNAKPRVIFDSAHNPEGINTFLKAFSKEEDLYNRKILIFGAMRDKAVKEMLQMLAPHFDEFYFTSLDMERAMSIEELINTGNELNLKSFSLRIVQSFIEDFISVNNKECLVTLGSMYILGNIKSKLLKKKLDIIFN